MFALRAIWRSRVFALVAVSLAFSGCNIAGSGHQPSLVTSEETEVLVQDESQRQSSKGNTSNTDKGPSIAINDQILLRSKQQRFVAIHESAEPSFSELVSNGRAAKVLRLSGDRNWIFVEIDDGPSGWVRAEDIQKDQLRSAPTGTAVAAEIVAEVEDDTSSESTAAERPDETSSPHPKLGALVYLDSDEGDAVTIHKRPAISWKGKVPDGGVARLWRLSDDGTWAYVEIPAGPTGWIRSADIDLDREVPQPRRNDCANYRPRSPGPSDRQGWDLVFDESFDDFDWHDGRCGTWQTISWRNGTVVRNPPTGIGTYLDKTVVDRNGRSLGVHPFQLEEGMLKITADRTPKPVKPYVNDRAYFSGYMSTFGSFAQRYGWFEIRVRFRKGGPGVVGAFWLMPAKRWDDPEIDIVEVILGRPNENHVAVHYKTKSGKDTSKGKWLPSPNIKSDFNVFAVDWSREQIVWYINGRQVYRLRNDYVHEPMHVIASMHVAIWTGGPTAETEFPAKMEIDYIRVYRRASESRVNEGQGS